MIHISKSPLAPGSANRASIVHSSGEYTRQNIFVLPPHHISHYLDRALKSLLLKCSSSRLIKTQIEEQ